MKETTDKKYLYKTEKRKHPRVKFNLDVYYPHLNNSVTNFQSAEGPVLQAINMSEGGLCFISKAPLNKSDFISFLMKIGDSPSFSCLVQVKWVGFDDEAFRVGCEFISLTLHQINLIKEYVKMSS